jgi:hypothetical protein
MIIIVLIGLFHMVHSPLLIVFPLIVKNYVSDIFYIIYFFTILFLYTFINGECPISYICKKIIDKNYIAGSNIQYYPEMLYLLHNQKRINYYFGTMTFFYIVILFLVIFRTNTFSYLLFFTFIVLSIYFLFIHNFFSNLKNKKIYFSIIQEITKYTLFLTICFLLIFIYEN